LIHAMITLCNAYVAAQHSVPGSRRRIYRLNHTHGGLGVKSMPFNLLTKPVSGHKSSVETR
jgi:hypothetical protein